MSSSNNICTKIKGFSDSGMEFQFIRQLGASAYRASSIGECFTIANTIKNCSPEEWVQQFERLAEWQKTDGLERLVKDHVVSGREQLFRASNSYRAAEYYSSTSSDHHNKLGLNSADCFCSALAAMDVHFENHSIPYNAINLPAYFISPANDGAKRKTIMIVSGFDGTMEEEFFFHGFAAIERGYNVILFAGPGSIDVFRKYPETYFKPDFENVVKRIINHFEFRQEIDKHHLSIMGTGSGSFFAIKAACHEPRIKALIANPPVLDLHGYFSSFVNQDPGKMTADDDFGLKELSSIPDDVMSTQLKAQTEQFIKRLGQNSFKASFEYLKNFSINASLDKLDIPCLALTGDHEVTETNRQFQEFCMNTNTDAYKFSDFEGAASHCQVGNISYSNAVAYDWLDSL